MRFPSSWCRSTRAFGDSVTTSSVRAPQCTRTPYLSSKEILRLATASCAGPTCCSVVLAIMIRARSVQSREPILARGPARHLPVCGEESIRRDRLGGSRALRSAGMAMGGPGRRDAGRPQGPLREDRRAARRAEPRGRPRPARTRSPDIDVCRSGRGGRTIESTAVGRVRPLPRRVADNRQVVFDDHGWRLKSDPAAHPEPAEADRLADLRC